MENLSPPLRFGIFAGLATVALMLIAYLLDPRLMLSQGVVWGSLLFYIYFMVQAIRYMADNRVEEGYIPFKMVVRPAFQVYLVATVIYYVFYYVMFNVVDTGLAELQQEMVLNQLEQWKGLLGEDFVAKMKKSVETDGLVVSPFRVMVGLGQSLVGGFILSLIIAGIIRSRL